MVIVFSKYSKSLSLSLIDSASKEKILKEIEDFNLKTHSRELTDLLKENHIKPIKEDYRVKSIDGKSNDPWEFLTSEISLIDIKDQLELFDRHKVINEAIKTVKDKDHAKLARFFEKQDEERQSRIREMFKSSIEANDLKYLKSTGNFLNFNLTQRLSTTARLKQGEIFQDFLLSRLPSHLSCNIIEFSGLQAIYSLMQVNKRLNDFLSKRFNLEHLGKIYCAAVFKNTNLYLNDKEVLRHKYRNFAQMLKSRPRVRFGGVYYSKVKYYRVSDTMTTIDGQTIHTVYYFRYMRFLPNGSVFMITSPEKKSIKILKSIKQGVADTKEGNYYIDDEFLYVQISQFTKEEDLVYKFKLVKFKEDKLAFNGFEFVCSYLQVGNDSRDFKVNEFFPKLFKYRSLACLERKYFIHKTLE